MGLQLDNAAKQLNGLTVALVTRNLIPGKGFRELVRVADASDKVFAMDSHTNEEVNFGARGFWVFSLDVEVFSFGLGQKQSRRTGARTPPHAANKESE